MAVPACRPALTSHVEGVEGHLGGGLSDGLRGQHAHSLTRLRLAAQELEGHEPLEALGRALPFPLGRAACLPVPLLLHRNLHRLIHALQKGTGSWLLVIIMF